MNHKSKEERKLYQKRYREKLYQINKEISSRNKTVAPHFNIALSEKAKKERIKYFSNGWESMPFKKDQ